MGATHLIIGDNRLVCTLHTLAFSSINGLDRLGKILGPTQMVISCIWLTSLD